MNLEKNIGENKFEHIYVFGCSHSLSTNSIDNTCKTYSQLIADKLEIPYANVYNFSINGSSNFENLYYLNCINSKLLYSHPSNSIRRNEYKDELPKKIYDNSLIIFQLTYWHRNVLQHTINKHENSYELIPLLPEKKYKDDDITEFNKIYYKKLSNSIYLQRNSLLPIYNTLKLICSEKNNVSTILLSWDDILDDVKRYVNPELTDIAKISEENKWRCCDVELYSEDLHLSPKGNEQLAQYLMKFI